MATSRRVVRSKKRAVAVRHLAVELDFDQPPRVACGTRSLDASLFAAMVTCPACLALQAQVRNGDLGASVRRH